MTLTWVLVIGTNLLSFCWFSVFWNLLLRRRWTHDLVTSRPEGVELRMVLPALEQLRATAPEGTEVPDLPPLPLEAHYQLRLLRRVRTWEVYLPAFMVHGIAAGLFTLEVEVLPARTRIKVVGVSPPPPPRPPRRPRGGRPVGSRRPLAVPQMPSTWSPGWA